MDQKLMQAAAFKQAQERADREDAPMRVWRRAVILTGETVWYVRAKSEPAPEGGAVWVSDFQPNPETSERARNARNLARAIGPAPAGRCDACGETTYADSWRPWACSSRCYADIMGIDAPGY